MASGDQVEKQRLQRLYRDMSDGELLRIAADIDSLTDVAQDALEDELDRRGLEIEEHSPGAQQVVERSVVTVAKFRDLPEALLAKGSLESAGIECFLVDDNMVRMDWLISNFIGGIKLKVKAEDAEAAERLLHDPIMPDFEVEGVGEFKQPSCPKCHSLDVTYQEVSPLAYLSLFARMPIPVQRKAWYCRMCGNEWE